MQGARAAGRIISRRIICPVIWNAVGSSEIEYFFFTTPSFRLLQSSAHRCQVIFSQR